MGEITHETAAEAPATSSGITRRQLLARATTSGAALAITALGGAAVGSLATQAEYELELTKLRALVALYEQLEKVGVDAVIATGMNIVGSALGGIKTGVRLIRDGITTTQNAMQAFQGMLDTLHRQVDSATQGMDGLMQTFHTAESVVVGVLGTTQPLTESIRGFFNALLDKIPFGIGDNVRRAVDALVSLINGIPAAIETVTAQLVQPLINSFFPPSGDAPVQTTLLNPITRNLLQPLNSFLGDVDKLVTHWEQDFTTPVQAALAQRQQIRQQIVAYRKEKQI